MRPAKVSLTVYNEANQELKQLTKVGEVRTFLEDLLHLNAHQFTQIVLLPQGDFRKFLNADSNDKEVVLRKLFKTSIYRQLAEQIKEKRKAYQAELAQEQRDIDILLEQIDWLEDFSTQQSELTGVEERLALLSEQLKQSVADQSNQREHLQRQWRFIEEQEAVLQTKQRLVEMFQERAKLETELDKLALRATEMSATETRLNELNWLGKQESALRRLAESQKEMQRLTDLEAKNTQETKKLGIQLAEITKQSEKLAEAELKMTERQQKVTHLNQLEPLLSEKLAQAKRQKEINDALVALSEEVSQRERSLAEIEEKSKSYLAEIDSLPDKRTKKIQLRSKIQQVIQWQEHSQVADNCNEELLANERKVRDQRKAIALQQTVLTTAEAELKQRKSQWASLQIARLSMELIPGEPCLVCGSTDHPAPHVEQAFTASDLRQTEENLETAEEALSAAQTNLVKVEEELGYLRTTGENIKKQLLQEENWFESHLPQGIERDKIQEALEQRQWSELNHLWSEEEDQLKLAEEKLTAEILKIEQHQTMLATSENEKIALTKQLEEVKGQQTQLQSDLLRVEATLTQLNRQVPMEWTSVEDLIEHRARLTKEVTDWLESKEENQQQVTALNNQLLVCQTNQQHYQEERQLVDQRIGKLVATLEQAIAATEQEFSPFDLLPRLDELTEIPMLEEKVASFQEAQQQTQFQLKQVKEKIGEADLPDLTPLLAEIKELKAAHHELERGLIQSEQQAATNEKLYKQIKDKHGRLASEWKSLAELSQLSEVANGDGPYNKKSLERYVLQAYFEEVLRVANSRLVQLTGNRYSFELKEEQGSYKSQTGLEINIYDDNVGAVRSVNTLSGGESFIAALALSLSLAEVVQSQTGGVQIEAMFIDEGFGALDEDALEMALNALELIEGKGRMIGIISHVSELKQRIPQQLRVIASGSGTSHVRYQTEQE